jgi:RNA polymerase sigma-70 factor (ECF subfamily)
MGDHELLAERFEEHRIRLRAVAYRMLGSLSEADDAVQEAWRAPVADPQQRVGRRSDADRPPRSISPRRGRWRA